MPIPFLAYFQIPSQVNRFTPLPRQTPTEESPLTPASIFPDPTLKEAKIIVIWRTGLRAECKTKNIWHVIECETTKYEAGNQSHN